MIYTQVVSDPRLEAAVQKAFRVAGRVAGVFAWQTAWHNRAAHQALIPLGIEDMSECLKEHAWKLLGRASMECC
jgi:hypothetical protein